MIYGELGRTGLKPSVLGIGAGGPSRLGLTYGRSRKSAQALLRAALERGVNFFDTAPAYGTEDIVGSALRDCRAKVILSTKATLGPYFGPLDGSRFASKLSARIGEDTSFVLSGPALESRANTSLDRLKTDYIDIFHLHTVMPGQCGAVLDRLLPTLSRLKESGKIRFIGITEAFGRDQTHETLARAAATNIFDCIMIGFNCLHQSGAPIAAEASRRGIGVIGMHVARGLCSQESLQRELDKLVTRGLISETHGNAETIMRLLNKYGVSTLAEAALRFARYELSCSVVLTGTGDLRHLEANIAACETGPLPDALSAEIRQLFRVVPARAQKVRH